MKFVDEVVIEVSAGSGGNGCVAFRREAHVPRGGPSGGDGGNGGDVVLRADTQVSTLLDYRYRQHFRAQRGEDGRGKDQYGKNGESITLRVPVGTQALDAATGDLLIDLREAGQEFVLASGGHGGLGNIHFAKPWNQTPRESTPGTPGEERHVRLELKLLADVGLLGFPNAGKSTLISKVSRARPKIADYPFTTLAPNLGVVRIDPERVFVMADIPGLIRGAADGAGLGHRFLKHLERTRILVHLLDGAAPLEPDRDLVEEFHAINTELARFAPDLAQKPQIVVVTKRDVSPEGDLLEELRARFTDEGVELHSISAITGDGLNALLNEIWRRLGEAATTLPQ